LPLAVATELSPTSITNILEAVPGIATVLRSPVADAIVNLSRAAVGLQPFDKKDALELIRYAVRRGLIRSDEGDRVTAEVEAAAAGRPLPPPSRPRLATPPPPVIKKAPAAVVRKQPVAKAVKKAVKAPPRAKKAAPRTALKTKKK
jgi:hypothetical protein